MDSVHLHRLRRLLLLHPNGVALESLPTAWIASYGFPLQPWQLGFQSCYAFVAAAPEAARVGPPPYHLVYAVLTADGVEDLVEFVKHELAGAGGAGSGGAATAWPGQPSGHVSFGRVQAGVEYYLAGRSFSSLGLAAPRALTELLHLDRRVGAAIEAFCAAKCVSTLWDLECHICAAEAVPSYESLRMGPLTAHPAVQRIFFSSAPPKPRVQPAERPGPVTYHQGGGIGSGPGPPPPVVCRTFSRVTSYDIAAAIRRQLACRGVEACRSAAAAGLASPQGATLLAEVLRDVAAVAEAMTSGAGCGSIRPATGNSSDGSQDAMSAEWTVWNLSRQLGVLANDLLLYVDVAAVAIAEEQQAVLRGSLAAGQPEAGPPAGQGRGGVPVPQGAEQGEGTGGRGGTRGRGPDPAEPPLPLGGPAYQFMSAWEQRETSRRQLKKMFIPSASAPPHPPLAGCDTQHLSKKQLRQLQRQRDLEKQAAQAQQQEAAGKIAGALAALREERGDNPTDASGSGAAGGSTRTGAGAVGQGGAKKEEELEGEAGGPGVSMEYLKDVTHYNLEKREKQCLKVGKETRRSIAQALGLPYNFTEDQLQDSFQRLMRLGLGGARVQVQPSPAFYPTVASLIVQQFIGPIMSALAESNDPKTKVRADLLPAKIKQLDTKLSKCPLLLLLLRALHAAMRGQLVVHDTQLAAVREWEAATAAARSGRQEATAAGTAAGSGGAAVGVATVLPAGSPGRDGGGGVDAADEGGNREDGGKEGGARVEVEDEEQQQGHEEELRDRGEKDEEEDDGDEPYIGDAAGRAALRSPRKRQRRHEWRSSASEKAKEKSEAAEGTRFAPEALRRVAASFNQMEEALSAARPDTGWNAEALGRFRQVLMELDTQAAAGGEGGGSGGEKEGVIFRRLRALSTVVDFLLQKLPRQQAAPIVPAAQVRATQHQQRSEHDEDYGKQEQAAQRRQPRTGVVGAGPGSEHGELGALLPAGLPPRADILAAFRTAVLDLRAGCSLLSLAILERAVATRLAQHFSLLQPQQRRPRSDEDLAPAAAVATASTPDAATLVASGVGNARPGGGGAALPPWRVLGGLGLGGSLLSALEAAGDGELLAAVAGEPEGPMRAPLYQVLEFLAEALRSFRLAGSGFVPFSDSSKPTHLDHPFAAVTTATAGSIPGSVARAIGRAVCSHFGVPRVESLGHGPVGHLLRLVADTHATPPLGWHSAVALAPPASALPRAALMTVAATSPPPGEVVGALGSLGRPAALAALRAVPVLGDLRLVTQWGSVFEAELGPLEEFLRTEGAAAGIEMLHLPVQPAGGPTLELAAQGRLIKLPFGTTVEDVVLHVAAGDPRSVAAALLSMVAAAGGVGGCPAGLLVRHIGAALADLARQAASRSDLADEGGAFTALRAQGLDSSSSQLTGTGTAAVGRPLPAFTGGPTGGQNALSAAAEGPGEAAACRFVLAVLPYIPLPLLAPLSEAVLLPALAAAIEGFETGGDGGWNGAAYGGMAEIAETTGPDAGMDVDEKVPAPGVDAGMGMDVPLVASTVAATSVAVGLGLHDALLRQVAALGTDPRISVPRSCLHHLGFVLGVEAWQDDWRKLYGTPGGDPAAGGAKQSGDAAYAGDAGVDVGGNVSGVEVAGADVAMVDADLVLPPTSSHPSAEVAPSLDRGAGQFPGKCTAAGSAGLIEEAEGITEPGEGRPQGGEAALAAEGGVGMRTAAPSAISLVLEPSMDPEECRQFVESIRREEFGLGVQLGGEAAALSGRLAARTGRALQRLAAELYSTDSHFVMELVQNADDNAYPAGVVPSLEFVLQRHVITVANNEAGFEPRHLRALCDVGASTKARVTGYIGQKGIGFKSVFRVSVAPQVHSRNFHVSFDLSRHGSLGYCLPDWCPLAHGSAAEAALTRLGCAVMAVPEPEQEAPAAPSFLYGTAIVLPLRYDMAGGGGAGAPELTGPAMGSGERGAVLRRRFADLSPTLLLFLQRLQRITVRDEIEGAASGSGAVRVVEMERRQVPATPPLVQLRVHTTVVAPAVSVVAPASSSLEGGGTKTTTTVTTAAATWAVVTASVQPSLPRAGVVVSETRVSLAFCLGPQTSTSTTTTIPTAAATFAFPTATTATNASASVAAASRGPESSTRGPGQGWILASSAWPAAAGGRPPQQPVFAYLPLRSYGLRFVVQGDWVVPSSRESLDADNPWNQGLRAQLPGLFLRALDVFKKLPAPTHNSTSTLSAAAAAAAPGPSAAPGGAAEVFWVDQWLRCVPLEGEAQGFFAGLPHSIATLLRAAPCIPLAGGGWSPPGETAVCVSSPLASELLALVRPGATRGHTRRPGQGRSLGSVTAGLEAAQEWGQEQGRGASGAAAVVGAEASEQPLLSLLGLRLVAPEARILYESRPLRALLGVREFGPAQLLEVLKTLSRQGHLARGDVGLPWLARSLLALFSATALGTSATMAGADLQYYHAPHAADPTGPHLTRVSLLRELRSLAILPLQGGGWASIEELAAHHRRSDDDSRTHSQGVNHREPYDGLQGGNAYDAGTGLVFFPLGWADTLGSAPGSGAACGSERSNARPRGWEADANGGASASSSAAATSLLALCGLQPSLLTGLRRQGNRHGSAPSDAAITHVSATSEPPPQDRLLCFLDESLLLALEVGGASASPPQQPVGDAGGIAVDGMETDEPAKEVAADARQRRRLLMRYLEELGVRHLQPTHLVQKVSLPVLHGEVTATTATATTAATTTSFSQGDTSPSSPAIASSRPHPSLLPQRELLVRCLALPLLAGMLGPHTGASAASSAARAAAATGAPSTVTAVGAISGPAATANASSQAAAFPPLLSQPPQHQPPQHQPPQHQLPQSGSHEAHRLLQSLRRRCLILTSHGVRLQAHGAAAPVVAHDETTSGAEAMAVVAAADNEECRSAASLLGGDEGGNGDGGAAAVYLPSCLATSSTDLEGLLDLLATARPAVKPEGTKKRKKAVVVGAGAASTQVASTDAADDGGGEWTLLDSAYVRMFPDLSGSWRWLFRQLGVLPFPAPTPRQLEVTAADLPASPWASLVAPGGSLAAGPPSPPHLQQGPPSDPGGPSRQLLAGGQGPWLVRDWTCEPLLGLVRRAAALPSPEAALAACDSLLTLLAAHWQPFEAAMEATFTPSGDAPADITALAPHPAPVVSTRPAPEGGDPRPSVGAVVVPSSIALALRAIAWLPAAPAAPQPGAASVTTGAAATAAVPVVGHGSGTCGGVLSPRQSPAQRRPRYLARPMEVFAPVPHVRGLLYDHVPYADLSCIAAGNHATSGESDPHLGSGGGGSRGNGVYDMLRQLGVVSKVTGATVVELLGEWSRGRANGGNAPGAGAFESSLAVMSCLYGFLGGEVRKQQRTIAGPGAVSGAPLRMEQGKEGRILRPPSQPHHQEPQEQQLPQEPQSALLEQVATAFAAGALVWLPDDPRVGGSSVASSQQTHGSAGGGKMDTEAEVASAVVPGSFHSTSAPLSTTSVADPSAGAFFSWLAGPCPVVHDGGSESVSSGSDPAGRCGLAGSSWTGFSGPGTPADRRAPVNTTPAFSAAAPAAVSDENAIDIDVDGSSDEERDEERCPRERGQEAVPGFQGPAGAALRALIAVEPSLDDYLRCLRICATAATAAAAAAAPASAPPGGSSMSGSGGGVGSFRDSNPKADPVALALRIIAHWARQLGSSSSSGANPFVQPSELRRRLQAEPLLPCISGRWAGLGPAVLLNDDPWVAEALAEAAGLELLKLPQSHSAVPALVPVPVPALRPAGAEALGSGMGAPAAGGLTGVYGAQQALGGGPWWSFGPSDTAAAAGQGHAQDGLGGSSVEGGVAPLAVAFFESLGVQPLSRCVKFSVTTEGPARALTPLESAARAAVLAAESYLAAMLPSQADFAARQDAVAGALPGFKVLVVSGFAAVLAADVASPAAAAARVVVRPPALMVGPVLYVRQDAATHFTAISLELSRLFRGGQPWPALAKRLLTALLTAAAGGDIWYMMAHQGVPRLPPPPPLHAPQPGRARVQRWLLPPPLPPPPPPPPPAPAPVPQQPQQQEPGRGKRKRKRKRAETDASSESESSSSEDEDAVANTRGTKERQTGHASKRRRQEGGDSAGVKQGQKSSVNGSSSSSDGDGSSSDDSSSSEDSSSKDSSSTESCSKASSSDSSSSNSDGDDGGGGGAKTSAVQHIAAGVQSQAKGGDKARGGAGAPDKAKPAETSSSESSSSSSCPSSADTSSSSSYSDSDSSSEEDSEHKEEKKQSAKDGVGTSAATAAAAAGPSASAPLKGSQGQKAKKQQQEHQHQHHQGGSQANRGGGQEDGWAGLSRAAADVAGTVTYQQQTDRTSLERLRSASKWWGRRQRRIDEARERAAAAGKAPPEGGTDTRLQAIGRWGEEVVFRHLMKQLEDQQRQRRQQQQQHQQQLQTGKGGNGASAAAAAAALVLRAPQQHPDGRAGSDSVDRVVWVNRERETGLPYDMYINHADDSVTYIEVKASVSATKDLFEISLPELRFAEEQGERYVLYRVLGAGGPSPSIVKLPDPVAQLRRRNMSLCLAV